MDKAKLAKLRAMGFEFDSAYDDAAERIEKSRADDAENKKRREEVKLKTETENQMNQDFKDFDAEDSFASSGKNTRIKRYYQALKYGKSTYGMDCNPCCMMYFLQSYGLIPPNMARKEFEYLLTTLNPPDSVKATKSNKSAKSANVLPKNSIKRKILFNDVFARVTEKDMFFGLFKNSELFLRGVEGAIFPHIPTSELILNKIANNFYQLSMDKNFGFLGEFHQKGASQFKSGDKVIQNCYLKLVNGDFTDKYFELGNTIFVGLAHYAPLPGHYCLIVDVPTSLTVDGIDFWVYPADDPLYGRTNVYVSKKNIPDLETIANLIYDSQKLDKFLIYPNCAIGI